jgi:hypothetical protein
VAYAGNAACPTTGSLCLSYGPYCNLYCGDVKFASHVQFVSSLFRLWASEYDGLRVGGE